MIGFQPQSKVGIPKPPSSFRLLLNLKFKFYRRAKIYSNHSQVEKRSLFKNSEDVVQKAPRTAVGLYVGLGDVVIQQQQQNEWSVRESRRNQFDR